MTCRSRLIALTLPLPLLLLTACGGLLPRAEPLDTYRLPTTSSATTEASNIGENLQLRVDTPLAAGLVASKRIVVLPAGNEVSVYHGARWNQPAPQLLRDRLIQAFRESGQLHAVFSDDSGLHADYVLAGTLDAFQAENRNGSQPLVVIDYDAMLLHNGNDVVATRHFHIAVSSTSSAIPAVVDTFGKAADSLAAKLTSWVYQEMSQAAAATPPDS